jgi:hypothetical protein
MDDGISSLEARLLSNGLAHIQEEFKRQGATLSGINQSLQVLARVEQSQVHISERLKEGSTKLSDHEIRLAKIESRMPGLAEMRRWVVGGILSGVAMIGVALVKLVIIS